MDHGQSRSHPKKNLAPRQPVQYVISIDLDAFRDCYLNFGTMCVSETPVFLNPKTVDAYVPLQFAHIKNPTIHGTDLEAFKGLIC